MLEPAAPASSGAPGTPPPLTWGVKGAFGIGQIAEGIQTAVFLLFLLFFYNQVLGVPGTLCGLALALALVFDAITDPVLGNLSDSWRSPRGRRHPFMYAAALPLGLCFIGLFNPLVSGNGLLFLWLLVFTIACRTAMTVYAVPHSALGAELSQEADERTQLVALRHFFGAIAFIMVFLLGFGVYFQPTPEYESGQLNPGAYGPFSLLLGALITASVWYSAFGTRSRLPWLPKVRDSQQFSLKQALRDTAAALRNDSFRWIILGFAVIIVAFGTAGAVNLYVLTFFWELDQAASVIVLIVGPVGSMFGYLSSVAFFRRFTKKTAVMIGIAIWLVAHSASVPLFLGGYLPERGSMALAWVVAGFAFVASYGIAQLLVGLGTMLADLTDEHELHSHQRQEGIFFGAFTFTNKLSAALGSLIGGTVLDLIRWPIGPEIRSAADVPMETIVSLGLVWGPMAGFLAIPGVWCVSRYALTRERHKAILEQLRGRTEGRT